MNTPVALFNSKENITPDCVVDAYGDDPEKLSDLLVSAKFISEYDASNDSFTSYRREVERFLHWMWLHQGKTLSDTDRSTIKDYFLFLDKIPKSWIGSSRLRRFIMVNGYLKPNPRWRPFISHTQSNNSKKATMAIIGSFYTYLNEENHCLINPVAMLRQKKRYTISSDEKPLIRRLTDVQWDALLNTLEADIAKGVEGAERALFLTSCFFLMGCRISELADHEYLNIRVTKMMSDFSRDGSGMWWFTVIGKGRKQRKVPVNKDMLAALKLYRESRDLSPLPGRGEQVPLLNNFSEKGRGLTSRMIRNIITEYFHKASVELMRSNETEAHEIMSATVHWLRHTSVSEQVKVREEKHAQMDAGHRSQATTHGYNDIIDKERHQSMEKLKLRFGSG